MSLLGTKGQIFWSIITEIGLLNFKAKAPMKFTALYFNQEAAPVHARTRYRPQVSSLHRLVNGWLCLWHFVNPMGMKQCLISIFHLSDYKGD